MRRKSGFTLAELGVSMLLLLLVLGLGVVQTRSRTIKADPKALAMVVAAELRGARAKAMKEGINVAIVFPSNDGQVPHSRSSYRLVGTTKGRVDRFADYSKESQALLAVASYPSPATTQLYAPSPYRPLPQLQDWPRDPTKDYIFMFAPDGRVVTNDLPTIGGNYHVVVCGGLDYETTGAPTGTPTMTDKPSYFALTAIAAPVSIVISPGGAVSVKPGLDQGDELPTSGALPAPPAPPTTPSSFPNTDPVFEGVNVFPEPLSEDADSFDAVLPLGIGSYQPHLELKVKASDPEGDPLTCEWASEPITGTEPGTFTVPDGPLRLSSDNVFVWNWYPPPSAVAGDRFRLTCTVKDNLGGTVALSGAAAIDVEMRDEGLIVFERPDNWGSGDFLWQVFGSGPPTRRLEVSGYSPRVSPDGTQIAFSDGEDLYFCKINGTKTKDLANNMYGVETDPAWAYDGTRVVYSEDLGSGPQLTRIGLHDKGKSDKAEILDVNNGWVKRKDWDDTVNVAQPATHADWSRDGAYIAFENAGEIYVMEASGANDGKNIGVIASDPGNDQRPRFSPDGQTLMFISDRSGTAQVYTIPVGTYSSGVWGDPTTILQRTTDGLEKVEAVWSPRYDSATGGDILYTAKAGSNLSLYRAQMPTDDVVTNMQDFRLSNLRNRGASPDWGP
ncbi:MAG: PD40 domain-containing protein [Candidatus Eremiobacteraeota bacterium]|nr:PD40 domain-containing protein [Candidatus Eremiobacteraeota bacterium]